MTLFPYGSALPWGQTVLSVHPGQERYGRGDGSLPAFEAPDHVAQGASIPGGCGPRSAENQGGALCTNHPVAARGMCAAARLSMACYIRWTEQD